MKTFYIDLAVKVVTVILGFACLVLQVFFYPAIFTTYEKVVINTIFTGYFILNVLFLIAVSFNWEIDLEWNAVWAVLGGMSYMGTGAFLISMFADRDDAESLPGTITGIVSIIEGLLLTLDAFLLKYLFSDNGQESQENESHPSNIGAPARDNRNSYRDSVVKKK